MKRIYLDHAATTPVAPEVFRAMKPYFMRYFGNPSALYKEGVEAKEAVMRSRERIASAIHAHPDEVVFTGSGTESDNLAITGTIKRYRDECPGTPHVITSAIEHPAVRHLLHDLQARGAITLTEVSVSGEGIVNPRDVREALTEETALVTIMYANNEIGTIQPIRDIAKVVRDYRKEQGTQYPYMHTDACQAFGYCEMHMPRLGVDLMTFNGSKIYGPKGVGGLFVRRGIEVAPLVYGGGQEKRLRAGTENVSGIVGLAEAVALNEQKKEEEAVRLTELRDYFLTELQKRFHNVSVNGSLTERLPNNINVSFAGVENVELIMRLDARGIACSAKSACKSSDEELSYVIEALGRARGEEASSVRFTLGRSTRKKDIDHTLKALEEVFETMSAD